MIFIEYTLANTDWLDSRVKTLITAEYSIHWSLHSTAFTGHYGVQHSLITTEYSIHWSLHSTAFTDHYRVQHSLITTEYSMCQSWQSTASTDHDRVQHSLITTEYSMYQSWQSTASTDHDRVQHCARSIKSLTHSSMTTAQSGWNSMCVNPAPCIPMKMSLLWETCNIRRPKGLIEDRSSPQNQLQWHPSLSPPPSPKWIQPKWRGGGSLSRGSSSSSSSSIP